MNIETRKMYVISRLTHLDNEEILSKIEQLIAEESDWWDMIGDDEKSEIAQGLSDIEKGRTKPHSEVMAKYNKCYRDYMVGTRRKRF